MKLYSILLALLIMTGQALGQDTYYVNSTTGSDTTANPNLQSTPLKTIQAAFELVQAGDTISLAVGEYPGLATTRRSGTNTQKITINGNNVATLSGSLFAIQFRHSYYHLTNVKIYSPPTRTGTVCGGASRPIGGGSGIQFWGDAAHHITVDFCDFAGGEMMLEMYSKTADVTDDQQEAGTAGAHNNLIENNKFHNIYADILSPTKVVSGLAINSNGYDNLFRANDFRDAHSNDVIHPNGLRNIFRENTFFGIQQLQNSTCTGIINHTDVFQVFHVRSGSKTAAQDIVIERNKFIDLKCQFMNVENNGDKDDPLTPDIDEYAVTSAKFMGNWHIRNNLFIHSRFEMNKYLPYFKIYNNTFYHNYDLTGSGANLTAEGGENQLNGGIHNEGKYLATGSTIMIKGDGRFGDIQNNLFIEVGTNSTGGFYGNTNLGGGGLNDNKPQATANYNQHSGEGGVNKSAGTKNVFGANDINGGDGVDYFIDPNPINGNYGLKAGSPAIGKGTNLSAKGFSNDFYGNTRTGTWDLGAIESGFADPTPTPSPTPTPTPTVTAPKFTTVASDTFTVGVQRIFTVEVVPASPAPTITRTLVSGTLPTGVAFTTPTPGNGTAKFSGIAQSGAGTSSKHTLTASNGVLPNATQEFTLNVKAAATPPKITSAITNTWITGVFEEFQINVDPKSPVPTISMAGTLPANLTFTDNLNGTAKIAGIATTVTGVTPPTVTITASNGSTPNAEQTFTPIVTAPPVTPTPTPAKIRIKP